VEKKYQSVRGTSDFSPEQCRKLELIFAQARQICKTFAYEEINLPILEEKGLFVRGVGEITDIVERQIFKVEGKDIVLRPEGTAGVVRHYLQHSLSKQSDFYKFFYIGPMFRGERPQRGRFRQFHHIGAEAIGSDSAYLDAEIIILCLKLLNSFGIDNIQLKINTLGCLKDKQKFSGYLENSLDTKNNSLCSDCRRRIHTSPLRVLDCKKDKCQDIVRSLNLGQSHLCDSCRENFDTLLSILDKSGIEYNYSPLLVRGLDYYTNTVFECVSDQLGSQDAIAAGGRYNSLVQSLGGRDTPAVGFALGVERVLIAAKKFCVKQKIQVFIIGVDESFSGVVFNIVSNLRDKGISCDCDYRNKSLKGQLRIAQKKEIPWVVIVGTEEWSSGCILLKDMHKSSQKRISLDSLEMEIKSKVVE